MASSCPLVPFLTQFWCVKGIIDLVGGQLVDKVKDFWNVAFVLPSQLRWHLVTANFSAGEAELVKDSFSRLLSFKLPLKHSVPLSLENAGKLEFSL